MEGADFSKQDLQNLWDIANACLKVAYLDEFQNVLSSVVHCLPSQGVIAGLGDRRAVNLKVMRHVVNAIADENNPQHYYLINNIAMNMSLAEQLSVHQTQLLSQAFAVPTQIVQQGLLQSRWTVGDETGLTLGWRCEHIGVMSLFSFVGVEIVKNIGYTQFLGAIVPHLHAALTRCAARTRSERRIELTGREREILQWILAGKTTWEISRILTISQRTVTYHVQNAMTKLGASTRSQAIANAARLGLLPLN
ncbi:MAG: helix-turn-helix transcriptional regulator [Gammaproteobacteria bacterium]|nr:helix-turn-helix transcriptional regulator [Gammaproteobacteria bacterium]